MSVYQVAIMFKAIGDEDASSFAEHLKDIAKQYMDSAVVGNAQISFVKFEEEEKVAIE